MMESDEGREEATREAGGNHKMNYGLSIEMFVPYIVLFVACRGSLWTYFFTEVFHENEFNMTIYGTYTLVFISFWFFALLFSYPVLMEKPDWLMKYRIQRGTNTPVDRAKFWIAIKRAFFNSFIVTPVFLLAIYPAHKAIGNSYRPEDVPGMLQYLVNTLRLLVLSEIVSYYSHRTFHWGPLYRRYHKIHHEWTAPVGLTAYNAHPIEYIFSILATIFIPAIVMKTHLLEIWIWVTLSNYVTVMHHCGFSVPKLTEGDYHDHHHQKYDGNYSYGPLDHLHKTDIGILKKGTEARE